MHGSMDDKRRGLVVDALSEHMELTERIGSIEEISVSEYTNYYGSTRDPAYLRFLLKVNGSKSKAWVWVKILNPDTESEVVTSIKIEG